MTPKSSLNEHKQQGARRILISGSSGLIGRAVMASRRRTGDVIVPLVRKKGTADALFWDPGSGRLDPALVSGFDTVIHLAGEPVVGLWNSARGVASWTAASSGPPNSPLRLHQQLCPPACSCQHRGSTFTETEVIPHSMRQHLQEKGSWPRYARLGRLLRNHLQTDHASFTSEWASSSLQKVDSCQGCCRRSALG
jgi:hypothetical protein